MRAGLMTETITFYELNVVKSGTGAENNTYSPVHRCRARKTYKSGSKDKENDEIVYNRSVVFEIRRGYDFNELYRILYDGDYYAIVSIEKFRDSTKIYCEKVNE